MRWKKSFTFISAIMTLGILIGCGSSGVDAAKAAASDVAAALEVSEQDISTTSEVVSSKTSESHQMMAMMILIGADMDSDLDSYDKVYLVDVSTSDGSRSGKVVVVVKDGVPTTVITDTLINP